nr:MAG TPA: capsid scaffolding protein [Caudoviricetes sp.]
MENQNTNTTPETDATMEAQEQEAVKTYTQEEVLKLLQSEADKRVNQALAKQKKEYEKKLSLSSLDEQQRKEAEAQMKIEELQAQLSQFQVEKNRSELKSVLSSRGLSAEFADIINIGEDIEQAQANIDALDRLFKASVKAEVEKRLSNNTPKGNGSSNAEITKETARKMSMAQLNQLAEERPELFKKLFD